MISKVYAQQANNIIQKACDGFSSAQITNTLA